MKLKTVFVIVMLFVVTLSCGCTGISKQQAIKKDMKNEGSESQESGPTTSEPTGRGCY